MEIPKKKIFLTLPLALISFEIYFGVLAGYFLGKLGGSKEEGRPGFVKSVVLGIGEYKIHLHHWLLVAALLVSTVFFNFYLPFPKFSYGFLGGLVFQGILSYSDWHKILVKKSKS